MKRVLLSIFTILLFATAALADGPGYYVRTNCSTGVGNPVAWQTICFDSTLREELIYTGVGGWQNYMAVAGGITNPLTADLDAAGYYIHNLHAGAASGDAMPVGQAAGHDLTGAYPCPIVQGIQSQPVASTTPAEGNILQYTGGIWVPTPMPTVSLTGTAGQDLRGTYPNPYVQGLQGVPVSTNTPIPGWAGVMSYNATQGKYLLQQIPTSLSVVMKIIRNRFNDATSLIWGQEKVLYADDMANVTHSLTTTLAYGASGQNVLHVDSTADFSVGNYIALETGGNPCYIWQAGTTCDNMDAIPSSFTIDATTYQLLDTVGTTGSSQFCVAVAHADQDHGFGPALTPNGSAGFCISNANNSLPLNPVGNPTNWLRMILPWPQYTTSGPTTHCNEGTPCAGWNNWYLWTKYKTNAWQFRGGFNYPTRVNPVEIQISSQEGNVAFAPDWVPSVETSEVSLPAPNTFLAVPSSPPSTNTGDYLYSRITAIDPIGFTITLADNLGSTITSGNKQTLHHDDEPAIDLLIQYYMQAGDTLWFGPHSYPIFRHGWGTPRPVGTDVSFFAPVTTIGSASLKAGITIKGSGSTFTTFTAPPCNTAGSMFEFFGTSETDLLTNVTLSDMSINMNGCGFQYNDYTADAISAQWTQNLHIDRVVAMGSPAYDIAIWEKNNGVRIQDTTYGNGWGDPVHVDCFIGPGCLNGLIMDGIYQMPSADAGTSIISSLTTNAPQNVHVSNSFFHGNFVFGGCLHCSLKNSYVWDDSGHDPYVFLVSRNSGADGVDPVWGNSDVDVEGSQFDRYLAGPNDFLGNHPAIIGLGLPTGMDNLSELDRGGGPIKFHNNSVAGYERVFATSCQNDSWVTDNKFDDLTGEGNTDLGLFYKCNGGLQPAFDYEWGNTFYGMGGWGLRTANASNSPLYLISHGDDYFPFTTGGYDYPAKFNFLSRMTGALLSSGTLSGTNYPLSAPTARGYITGGSDPAISNGSPTALATIASIDFGPAGTGYAEVSYNITLAASGTQANGSCWVTDGTLQMAAGAFSLPASPNPAYTPVEGHQIMTSKYTGIQTFTLNCQVNASGVTALRNGDTLYGGTINGVLEVSQTTGKD